mgnify:CR=1 FL=1
MKIALTTILTTLLLCTSLSAQDLSDDLKQETDNRLRDLDREKSSMEFQVRRESRSAPMAALPDLPEACNPYPIPTTPQGPVIKKKYSRWDDTFDLTVWRYPCDEQSSYVIFTINPTSNEPPFVCSVSITYIQDEIQTEDYKLTQDPAGEAGSFCGDVVIKTSLAITERYRPSPEIDLERSFDVFWDLGDHNERFTVFAYDPSDYGIGEPPPPESMTNDMGISGLFFDPNNSGHGFDINKHEQALVIYYYGHSAGGQRLWLISENYYGDIEFNTEIKLGLIEIAEGTFGNPVFNPSDWGELTIEFADCDTGHATLDGIDGKISFDFIRLTGLEGTSFGVRVKGQSKSFGPG